jgi:hypothetical protein
MERKRIKLYVHRDKESNFFLEEKLKIPWAVAKYVGYEIEVLYEFDGEKFELIAADGFFLDKNKPVTFGDVDLDEAAPEMPEGTPC